MNTSLSIDNNCSINLASTIYLAAKIHFNRSQSVKWSSMVTRSPLKPSSQTRKLSKLLGIKVVRVLYSWIFVLSNDLALAIILDCSEISY